MTKLSQPERKQEEPPAKPFVPSERPRDVMMRYVLKELGRLCVWQAEFDAVLRPLPRQLAEDEIALNHVLRLLQMVEASPKIQSELIAMTRVVARLEKEK